MIIGMPSDGLWGDGTGYVAHHGIDFENWILEDVVDVIRECFPQAAATSPLFIGGLSMGGFGALWLAAKHPERFAGVSAHSSVTDLTQLEGIVSEGSSLTKAGGTDQWSVFAWMLKHKKRLPAIRFDCGLDDHLLGQNRELRQKLEKQGIPHRYEEFPGGHEWAYWREHIKDSLLFFEAQLD
jgi:enterochelin esterase-like enzyme